MLIIRLGRGFSEKPELDIETALGKEGEIECVDAGGGGIIEEAVQGVDGEVG